ncbi:hypothetical protein AYO20_09105 [Fonsecaea nubica]|uniref:Uncharacterized protein n=1 Tax=Fonsecaea nubica TaxID=856822 RepID=A0A178CLL2_9EURO|nr:hypothetical protein AYO20_09105 [Fonsecaea nubica]OAL29721.1 hypothetical protein AYO20_09105 [Fonsecaea nubica]
MATHDDVSQTLDSLKIVALYRVRGGTAQDRSRKMTELSGALYMFRTRAEGIESAILLFEDHDAVTTIDWSEICRITELGHAVGHRDAQIITLPDPLDTNYTTYVVSEDQLVINLLPPFVERGRGMSIDEKGRKSLQWIVESHARRTCVVNWPAAGTLMQPASQTVPWMGTCNNRQHWIHEFVPKLCNLETLTLSGCGYDSQCLSRLRGWTGQLDIEDDKGESEECRESNEIDK